MRVHLDCLSISKAIQLSFRYPRLEKEALERNLLDYEHLENLILQIPEYQYLSNDKLV